MIGLSADIQSLKSSLESLSSEQFDSLKQVAVYYRLVRALRILGLIGLGLCVCSWIFYFNYFTIVHIIVNFLMVVFSLWAIINPTVNGFRALAFALLICGLWNLFSTFYIGLAVFNVILAGIGVLQLAYVFQSYKLYQHFVLLSASKPVVELKQQYDIIWKSIVASKTDIHTELVWLTLIPNQNWWQTLLSGTKSVVTCLVLLSDQAVIAYRDRKWLEFIPKSNLIIEPAEGYSLSITKTKAGIEKITDNGSNVSMGIFARINDVVFTGYIYLKGFARYVEWKQFSPEAIETAVKTETFSSERQSFIKRQKRISNAIILYFVIAVILIILIMQRLPQS